MPIIDTDEQLIAGLQSCSLSNWQSYIDALTAQFDRALAAAILESEPKARRISLPPTTIRNRAELDEWITRLENTIQEALREGPVIL